jgi:pyrroline-5-carboxylate reductase
MEIRLGIVGAGNMGRAIVEGAIAGGVVRAGELIVAELDPRRRAEVEGLGCRAVDGPAAVFQAPQIVLAVKPQSFPDLARSIGTLASSRVVISIMAGIPTSSVADHLGGRARVIRAMPNTPCRLRAGVTAIAPGCNARPGDEGLAVRLFEALGRTVIVEEAAMDAVTAVSGSGPAYVFLLAEAMESAARTLGLPAEVAAILTRETIRGAGRMLVETGSEPALLRREVTSPGGTTEAALRLMNARDLPGIVAEAIAAARDRGAELARRP